jgi:sugar-specific transcriptional regulator TrmB
MMDTQILEELGLSKGESNVYLTLLKLGATKVGAIIEKSEMASSAVHNSLNTLLNKGLISYVKKGKIKLYQTAPPKYIGNFVEKKLEKFKEMLPSIEQLQKSSENKQEAEVFEGIKGLTTMLNLIIENTKKGQEYIFFASTSPGKDKEIQDFFEKYDFKRKEKGLYVKGLAPPEIKNLFKNRKKLLHMKYPSFPIPADLSIVGNNVAITSWGEKPVGFLIRSKQISDIYRKLFNDIWNLS